MLHDVDSAEPGYNLHTSRRWTEARLISMSGQTAHSWRAPPPGRATLSALEEMFSGWQQVELLAGGHLLVVVELRSLLRLDRESVVMWEVDLPVHHDVAVAEDGRIAVLASTIRWHGDGADADPFVDNLLLVLDQTGKQIESLSLWDILLQNPQTRALLERSLSGRRGWRRRFERVTMPWDLGEEAQRAATEIAAAAVALKPSIQADDRRALMALLPTPAGLDTKHALWSWGPGSSVASINLRCCPMVTCSSSTMVLPLVGRGSSRSIRSLVPSCGSTMAARTTLSTRW